MIRDELSGLTVFLAVAERRSFTGAAADLGVTASAVSQAVSALEERLGLRLLQRTTRSVGLTEAGERFLGRLRPALAEIKETFEEVGRLRDRPSGVLRLSVPRVASRALLEPVLATFLSAYPEISVEVAVEDGITDIIAQGFDAGIRLGETLDREMVAVKIAGDEEMAVVGSPAYFAAHRRPKCPRDLHAHACINYRRITSREISRWEFTEDGKDFDLAVSGRVVCNDPDLMVKLALDGVGLAYVFASTVREHLAKRRLLRVLKPYCPPFPGMYLYFPSRTHLSPKLQALVGFLRASGKTQRGPR